MKSSTANHAGDLAVAQREANELRGELGAVQLALADVDNHRRQIEERLGDSETLAEEQRAEIATLQMRRDSLELRLADLERAAKAAAERAVGERDRLKAALADAEARLARSEAAREEAVLESRRQLARIVEPSAAAPVVGPAARGDKALRAAIARLGRDIARIERRRAAEAPPINLATPPPLLAPAGKIRQGEPAAREG